MTATVAIGCIIVAFCGGFLAGHMNGLRMGGKIVARKIANGILTISPRR